MARPSLPVGTWGRLRVHQQGPVHVAIAKYKDHDGVARPVQRVGETKAKAQNNLLEALRDRARRGSHGEVTPGTKVHALASMWLKTIDESDKAARTKREYHDTWNRYLAKPVGQLTIDQFRVSTANRIITTVRDQHGRGAASHCKVVLSGILALAVRHDAIDKNPVREIESLGKKKRKKERLVNESTISEVLGVFEASEDAARWDLIDMVNVLSGVGCRLGELLALDWDTSVDFTDGTLCIHGTAIRVTGQGLYVQDHTKSPAGMRTVRPPEWVMQVLERRHAESESMWVFPSAAGTLRDPDNTRKYVRKVVKKTGYAALHLHDFRHYVASKLDRAGLTAREIADYLGHERITTTQEDYLERGIVGEACGPALADQPVAHKPKGRV